MHQLLQQAALFQTVTEKELLPIAAVSEKQRYPANYSLFARGEPAEHFFLILSGSVRLYRLSSDGREKVIEIIRTGETFAEAVALLERPYPVYADTIETTELIEIPAQSLRHAIENSTALSLKMLSGLSLRLHKFIGDIHALSMSSAEQKVAGYFLAFLTDDNSEQRIELPSKKAIVASRLGLQPETFSRVLRKLKKRGIISEDDAGIIVLRADLLKALRDC